MNYSSTPLLIGSLDGILRILKRKVLVYRYRLPRRHKKTFMAVFCLIGFMFWYFSTQVHKLTLDIDADSYQSNNRDDLLLLPTEKKTYTSCLKDKKDWAIFHEAKINRTIMKWKSFMDTVDEYPLNKFQGRGIVTSTRKTVYPRFLATIRLIRWYKSTLPIEVFQFPNELNEKQLADLRNIDHVSIRILDNRQSFQDRNTNRYAIKLRALLESKFEHILWLDGDNIPVRDPEYLFDLPHYTRSTAMFWPDFWTSYQNNPIWQMLNLSCRAEDYEQEAGQILINKKLSWKALHLAIHLNGDTDVMKVLLGDKDTFRLSWRVLNIPFYFIRKYLGIAGFYHRSVNGTEASEFCGHTMVQHDPFGEVIFLHANMIKYHPNIKYTPESKHPELMHLSNPWRVLRRYANTASYLKALIYRKYDYSCTTFPTDGPPLYEEDFHHLISPNITMMYLRFLKEQTNDSVTSEYASVVD
jgi:alpha 1,2-mannosyltransferase